MGQTHRVGKTATKVDAVAVHPYFKYVQYHKTAVVRWNDDEIRLNTGGWYSATTKNRMNQTSNQFALGFRVYQLKHAWYVYYRGTTIPFDGREVILQRHGPVIKVESTPPVPVPVETVPVHPAFDK